MLAGLVQVKRNNIVQVLANSTQGKKIVQEVKRTSLKSSIQECNDIIFERKVKRTLTTRER